MHIALIWAMAANGVIGRDNRLPWRLPADMQFFLMTTMSKPVIMGRKTFESMKAPLPGRTNIVVTRNASYQAAPGVVVVDSFDIALDRAREQCLADGRDEIMVAGGEGIYKLALPQATRLYVTQVQADIDGDTKFTDVDWSQFSQLWRREYPADRRHPHAFSISQWDRK